MSTAVISEWTERTLPVSTDEKSGVTATCPRCGNEVLAGSRRKTCSDACRQAKYRTSPAYQKCLADARAATLQRKLKKRAAISISKLDGRTSGTSMGRRVGKDVKHIPFVYPGDWLQEVVEELKKK